MRLKIKKLLLVDDDKDVVEIMKDYFEDFAEEIQVAYDGQEALAIYQTFQPDIIITDLTMPHMNGLTMSKEILEINKDQKIIICTAHFESHYETLAKNIGIKHTLTKPVDIELLLKYMQE